MSGMHSFLSFLKVIAMSGSDINKKEKKRKKP
jgi:hypothetical protein